MVRQTKNTAVLTQRHDVTHMQARSDAQITCNGRASVISLASNVLFHPALTAEPRPSTATPWEINELAHVEELAFCAVKPCSQLPQLQMNLFLELNFRNRDDRTSQFKSPVDAALHDCLFPPWQDRQSPPPPPVFCAKADKPLEKNSSEWCLPKSILLWWQKYAYVLSFPCSSSCLCVFCPEMPPLCFSRTWSFLQLIKVIML